MAVDADGNLVVSSNATSDVFRYHGLTGNLIDVIASVGQAGLNGPTDVLVGADDNVYVSSGLTHEVLRFIPPPLAGTGQTELIKTHREFIRIINRAINDAGPFINTTQGLQGDEFGGFGSALRGQDNNHEGVYIDDIIIGFAERGEMITAAVPDNTTFTAASPATLPGQTLLGPYELEIRRSADFGTSQPTPPFLALDRSLDTNDRLADQVTFVAPFGYDVFDSQTISLSDGLDSVTLEFEDLTLPFGNPNVGVAPGNVQILFDPSDTDYEVAERIRNAINSSQLQDQANIDVTAAQSDGTVTGSGSTSNRVDLYGPAASDLFGNLNFGFPTDVHNDIGDQNRFRDQGQVLVHSNFITDSSQFGVVVEAGVRSHALVPLAGALPHTGPVRNLREPNTNSFAPGATVSNNVIANNVQGGIHFSGDPNPANQQTGASPFGRIINNTLFGSGAADTGILVDNNGAPTLSNNAIVNFGTGISVNNPTGFPNSAVVIGHTLYEGNTTNVAGFTGLGDFPLNLPAGTTVFVDPNTRNFYPATGSAIIDSANDSLEDRAEIITLRDPLGIAPSPILAPTRDVFGQLRVDDPTVAPPAGLGANVFKDRGATDRADSLGPTASLLLPLDNDSENNDIDPTVTVVQLTEGVLDHFDIVLLDDNGTGPDFNTLTNLSVSLTGRRSLPDRRCRLYLRFQCDQPHDSAHPAVRDLEADPHV